MKHYRYNAESSYILNSIYPTIVLKEFTVIKETPKGYWISGLGEYDRDRWVSKTSRKRYAYPTKEEAFESFKRRTEIRLAITKEKYEFSKKIIYAIENYDKI